MSGPVGTADEAIAADDEPSEPCVEVTESHEAEVEGITVRRALPRAGRRTVGAWCFVDHMGPAAGTALGVGPHPHIGLQTVTWLLSGEVLHVDSLGTEQLIRPGQLNLMTAGDGVAHAEEGQAAGDVHGVQLWVAQPDETRGGAPDFEHHTALPQVELDDADATVLIGSFAGATSPARRDTDHLGVDIVLRAGSRAVPLEPQHEHALIVTDGEVDVAGERVGPGRLAYLGLGRDELDLGVEDDARVLLVGGVPFPAKVLMWWNYVARTHDEIDAAHADWSAAADRFGTVASSLGRIDVGPPPWQRSG